MAYKIDKLSCPSCGAGINMDIQGRKTLFCPFCGSQFSVDDGERVYTHNINIHKRYTDDAAVEKEIRKDRENARQNKAAIFALIILSILLVLIFVDLRWWAMSDDVAERNNIDAGLIKVGQASSDMEGKKYHVVEEQLKSAGFTNITEIDLDDAGWLKKEDTIESITINGEASFSSDKYFSPDAKVIITYH
ncbi:hypothetical protein [Butyrivibrio sp. WCD3002]|uniref:hypothetical protein n=1 Tax=Butyrivibrio sp. WCD3002 TaxID=1280676 RepID=UPI00041BE5C6|nr:hypothetical protein [Butyrivibrio sp. WCD3002]